MKTVRNLIQALCILLIALSITNCQNDTINEIQEEESVQKEFPFKSSLLSKQDVETNAKLSMHMRSLATLQSSSSAESVYNELYNFTIDTDVANFVESTENDSHSYTFPISRENNTGSALENIVFSYNAATDDYEASLVTYHFTAAQQQEFIFTKHVSSSYDVSFEPIAINISDILGENIMSTPCTTSYTVYHITPDTGDTFVYGSGSTCEHENDDDPCDVYTVIEIDCPDGGSTSANDSGVQNPYNNPNNTSSGGNNSTTNDGDAAPNNDTNDDVDNIVTSAISRQEIQEITEQLNNILGEDNWHFDNNEGSFSFDSVEELESFISEFEDSFTIEDSEIVINQDNTKTIIFKGKFSSGLIIPIYINIHVTIVLDDPMTLDTNEFELEETKSNISGLLPAVDWEQYSHEQSTNGDITTVIVRGAFVFGIKMPYINNNLSYTEQWQFTVTFNNQTGEAIDIVAEKLN